MHLHFITLYSCLAFKELFQIFIPNSFLLELLTLCERILLLCLWFHQLNINIKVIRVKDRGLLKATRTNCATLTYPNLFDYSYCVQLFVALSPLKWITPVHLLFVCLLLFLPSFHLCIRMNFTKAVWSPVKYLFLSFLTFYL